MHSPKLAFCFIFLQFPLRKYASITMNCDSHQFCPSILIPWSLSVAVMFLAQLPEWSIPNIRPDSSIHAQVSWMLNKLCFDHSVLVLNLFWWGSDLSVIEDEPKLHAGPNRAVDREQVIILDSIMPFLFYRYHSLWVKVALSLSQSSNGGRCRSWVQKKNSRLDANEPDLAICFSVNGMVWACNWRKISWHRGTQTSKYQSTILLAWIRQRMRLATQTIVYYRTSGFLGSNMSSTKTPFLNQLRNRPNVSGTVLACYR